MRFVCLIQDETSDKITRKNSLYKFINLINIENTTALFNKIRIKLLKDVFQSLIHINRDMDKMENIGHYRLVYFTCLYN